MIASTDISKPLKMKNPIQTYAWGSHSAIADLLGKAEPTPKPQAELWMGAHPKASSEVWYQERWQALDQLISEYPQELLGELVTARFGPQLPFLFKVLAVEKPLSIQAHPDKVQAEAGFYRENRAGIDLNAARRNYTDSNHKPECICAITPFTGLCGFRTLADMMTLLGTVWPQRHNHLLTLLTTQGIRAFFAGLMALTDKDRVGIITESVENASNLHKTSPAFYWMSQLNQLYPNDIGVLAPLWLHVVDLKPGEAIYLPSRQLHAYLKGVGIEIMANSDNVIRGGLTPKHIDVPELMTVLDFSPQPPFIIEAYEQSEIERIYSSPAEEFLLTALDLTAGRMHQLAAGSIAILFCIQGSAAIEYRGENSPMIIDKGESVLLPAALRHATISGSALVYLAEVHIQSIDTARN